MCGRFTLRAPDRIKLRLAKAQQLPLAVLSPRYNIAPSQDILVITAVEGQTAAAAMRWGLIPSWSTEPKGFINARAETLELRPSFSESFQRRRCLIPADGFYEWARSKKSKQPHYFQMQDEAPFAFAGLWDVWQQDGVRINSCAIITTGPNELLATIHDRMPVILPAAAHDEWLRDDAGAEDLMQLLAPFSAAEMKSFPVSREVNHAGVDEAKLVEPVELVNEPQTGMLF